MSNFELEEFLPFRISQIRRCRTWKKDWWRCRVFFSVQKWVVCSNWYMFSFRQCFKFESRLCFLYSAFLEQDWDVHLTLEEMAFFGMIFWMAIFDIRQCYRRKNITFHLKQRPSPFHILKWTTNNVKFCVKSFCHWLCLNSGGVTPGKSNVVYKWSGSVVFRAVQKYIVPGADPGFFLRGGALVSCSTSTPINHIVFFGQNTSCIRKPQVISGGGGGVRTPLHPPLRSAPEFVPSGNQKRTYSVRRPCFKIQKLMFCLFYIPRVRMVGWFEFKKEKTFVFWSQKRTHTSY